MAEENRPVSADANAGDADVTKPLEGDILKQLGEKASREFGSVEDALKYVENLNKFSGDQAVIEARKKAKAYDELAKVYSSETGESLDKLFPADSNASLGDKRVDLLEFMLKDGNDKYKPYQDKIKYFMDKGWGLDEAVKEVDDFVRMVSPTEKKTGTLETNKRLSGTTANQKQKAELVTQIKAGNSAAKEALVAVLLKEAGLQQ